MIVHYDKLNDIEKKVMSITDDYVYAVIELLYARIKSSPSDVEEYSAIFKHLGSMRRLIKKMRRELYGHLIANGRMTEDERSEE